MVSQFAMRAAMASPTHSGSLCNSSRVVSFCLQIQAWLLILFFSFCSIRTVSAIEISYRDHCNSIVPESSSTGSTIDPSNLLQFQGGFFRIGEQNSVQYNQYSFFGTRLVIFNARNLYKTESQGILKVDGILEVRGGNLNKFSGFQSFNRSGRFRVRQPRIKRISDVASFELKGFWSESNETLCMVGSSSVFSPEGSSLDLSAVLKLHYPKNWTILSGFVAGSVESLDNAVSVNYFQPISILELSQKVSQKTYEYTLITEPKNMCSGLNRYENPWPDADAFRVDGNVTLCSMISREIRGFRLEYDRNCKGANCSPFGSLGFLPSTMFVQGIQCSDKGKAHFALVFSNSTGYIYNAALIPEFTLVFEGIWDEERNQLCMVGCRLMNFTDHLEKASVGDCTIGLSLQFPETLSLRNRNSVLGQIWSNKNVNDSGYFERLKFWRVLDYRMLDYQHVRYKYTEMDRVKKSCGAGILASQKAKKNSRRRYPDGLSFRDMSFDMSVKNSRGQKSYGYATPFTRDHSFYGSSFVMASLADSPIQGLEPNHSQVQESNHSQLNVSYRISIRSWHNFNWSGLLTPNTLSSIPKNIAAEGIYNVHTGTLCMIGCRYVDSKNGISNKSLESMDCEILIDVQLPPLNVESFVGEDLNGTIKSTREKSDPLYFDQLELSSHVMYAAMSEKSIQRMDLEIIMVLISLTLASVFIGLQLFYVKKHAEVLPSISLLMLVVLTLGHMIPLVLNFEAFFMNHKRQDGLLWSGRWLEVNEVIVRVFTMVAFLLQFRLLQLALSARLGDDGQKRLWVSEKKTVYSCLPLFIVGGLIACFVHWKASVAPFHNNRFLQHAKHSLWEDLRSYAGLVLDGFLLPQVLLNFFLDSKDKVLAPSFYIGTTIVRLLPHAYDVYRAGRYAPEFDTSYFYANPDSDFYSSAWDVTILCGGLVLTVIILLQQRFGGRFFLPQRFRESLEYQKVPVVNG